MSGKPISESMRRYEEAKKAATTEPRYCVADGCVQALTTTNQNIVFCAPHFRQLSADLHRRLYNAQQSGDMPAYYLTLSECKQHLRACQPVEHQRVLLTGNTFPVKEQLKAMGATWDPNRQGWWIDATKRLAAEVMIGNVDRETGDLFGSGFDNDENERTS